GINIDPPRDFEEAESTETSLTLRWQKPRAKVSGYRLVYVSRDGQVEEVEIPATATSYVVSNLTPGMSYTHTLTAERGHKSSTPVTLTASTGGWGTTLTLFDFRIIYNTFLLK
uniref:Fibronectin type-III domain-containing protein n=1 Tax=Seriola lalandi dorsalis TaxID=1841481 RepID=A0A3B4XEL1_SERLL